MNPVIFHPEAEQEANDAVDYYDRLRSELGDHLRSELTVAVNRIRDNPLLYAIDTGLMRICILRRFPYSIQYEIHETNIWVAAVAHQKRKPDYWMHRKPN